MPKPIERTRSHRSDSKETTNLRHDATKNLRRQLLRANQWNGVGSRSGYNGLADTTRQEQSPRRSASPCCRTLGDRFTAPVAKMRWRTLIFTPKVPCKTTRWTARTSFLRFGGVWNQVEAPRHSSSSSGDRQKAEQIRVHPICLESPF